MKLLINVLSTATGTSSYFLTSKLTEMCNYVIWRCSAKVPDSPNFASDAFWISGILRWRILSIRWGVRSQMVMKFGLAPLWTTHKIEHIRDLFESAILKTLVCFHCMALLCLFPKNSKTSSRVSATLLVISFFAEFYYLLWATFWFIEGYCSFLRSALQPSIFS